MDWCDLVACAINPVVFKPDGLKCRFHCIYPHTHTHTHTHINVCVSVCVCMRVSVSMELAVLFQKSANGMHFHILTLQCFGSLH